MRITAINSYKSNLNFNGDNSGKANKLKTAAGAAAIALATAMPMEDTDAQIFYPPVVYPQIYPTMPIQINKPIPDCFITGDNGNVNYNKNMKQVFNELDKNKNGTISANEVLRTEKNNWNRYNIYYPFTQQQMMQTESTFNSLAESYNEEDSNPTTINYNEYKDIMNDYMESKQISDFVKLFTLPGIIYPLPPHHHYHDIHRHHDHHHHHRY